MDKKEKENFKELMKSALGAFIVGFIFFMGILIFGFLRSFGWL